MNFTNYKFHCHTLPYFAVNPRKKGEVLSETTKSYLKELWIREVFGRQKYDSINKYTAKGIACESDSLDLVQQVTGKAYFKNKKQFENEWIVGTPDIVTEEDIKDIKTSFDIWSFAGVDAKTAEKTYLYQLLGYMWLCEKKAGELIYCLVNTPEEIMNDELRLLSYKLPEIDTSEEFTEQVKRNFIFDDIDPQIRIKRFNFAIVEEEIELIKERIEEARVFMNSLNL